MPHLWEYDRPTVPDDENDNPCEDFAELRGCIEDLDPELNQIYAFQWWLPDERFAVYLLTDSYRIAFSCPIDRSQEDEVLAWLHGPRVLGTLKQAWAPIIDGARHPTT